VTRPTRADAGGRAYLDLQNLARRQGRQTQTLMVIYVLERFLARLEVSGYKDRFVLKGGMLLAAWDARRATVDADFLARNLNLDEESALRRVVEIAALPAPVDAQRPSAPEHPGVPATGRPGGEALHRRRAGRRQ
jgi:hypothetical protein